MKVSKALVQLPTKPHALYRFYDRTDVLLYVGITMDLPARIGNHRKERPWWTLVHNMTVEHFDTRTEALAVEAQAIKTEQPLYNSTHNELVQAPVVERTAHEFADIMLRHLAEHPDRYAEVLREAEESVREAENDPDDDLAGADPLQYAAELEADNVVVERHLLRLALDYLMAHLPEERVNHAMARAREQRGDDPPESEVVRGAAFFVAADFARDYLDDLPGSEGDVWRQAARNMFSVAVEPELIEYHAAGYARAFKAERSHEYGKAQRLCRAPADDGVACPELATAHVVFKDCRLCTAEVGGCKGHDLWCDAHLRRALEHPYSWTSTGEPAIVHDYTGIERVDPWDEPPF